MEKVEIRIIPEKVYKNLAGLDISKIKDIIYSNILPKMKGEYFRIDVKVKRRKDGKPKYFVANFLRKDVYTVERVRIDVRGDEYKILKIDWDYSGDEDEEEVEGETSNAGGVEYSCDHDFAVGTPVPEIESARNAVEYIFNLARSVGLNPVKMMGPEANLTNYKRYLRCGLKGFVNIGHGNRNGIVLYDGFLSYRWFCHLSGQPLRPAVVYFNSCQVMNDPLKNCEMHAGARTFIGGIISLLIGPSEEVCKCFWDRVLHTRNPMGNTLHECEREKYPETGAHGIVGDTGPFTIEASRLIPIIVVLWEHVGFRGRRRTLIQDTPNLLLQSFNDKVSSIGIHKGPDYDQWKRIHGKEPVAEFFEHINYRGKSIILPPGAYANIHSLFGFGDVISSVKFTPSFPEAPEIKPIPLIVEIYEHANFRGKRATIVENVADIISYLGWEFNDVISSVRVIKGPDYSPGMKAHFFQHINYRGRSISLNVGNYPNIGASHGFNDVISSIKVR